MESKQEATQTLARLVARVHEETSSTYLASLAARCSDEAERLERHSANLRHVAELALERMDALQERPDHA